ncbi:MAG: hypothetical protein R3B55_01615 [Candidatus Paceibacterota bacterium]
MSDLDSFAYVDLKDDEIESGWQNPGKELKEKYPFVEDLKYTQILPKKSGILLFLNLFVCMEKKYRYEKESLETI